MKLSTGICVGRRHQGPLSAPGPTMTDNEAVVGREAYFLTTFCLAQSRRGWMQVDDSCSWIRNVLSVV